jgi:hypothetical protein
MDKQLFHLNDDWALAYDKNQWIVQRGWQYKGDIKWQSVSFIAGKKSLLERVLDDKGIQLTPNARKGLKSLPDTFKEWLLDYDSSKWAAPITLTDKAA